MTTSEEWSVNFDILYNNISSNQAPGLTEYEKSVFLTQAQEAVILDLYKGTSGDAFETTEEVTRYLSSLVKTHRFNNITPEDKQYVVDTSEVDNLWFITYQSGSITVGENTRDVIVVPSSDIANTLFLLGPLKGLFKSLYKLSCLEGPTITSLVFSPTVILPD